METEGGIYFTDQRADGLEIEVYMRGKSQGGPGSDHALHGVKHDAHPLHHRLLVGGR